MTSRREKISIANFQQDEARKKFKQRIRAVLDSGYPLSMALLERVVTDLEKEAKR